MSIAYKDSTEAYEEKYKTGYGLIYPDGHVIRLYEKFLKYELSIDGSNHEKILDFGCGNGTHLKYFAVKGFEIYGVDVAKTSIEMARNLLPQFSNNLVAIEAGQDISSIFNVKFDIIFANQSLYYLNDRDLDAALKKMYSMLKLGGIVYFTMMGAQSYYYNFSAPTKDTGLRKVSLTGRLNETTYINFINNEDELKIKFNLFKPLFTGHYDISMREGSGMHYQFLGIKE